MNASNSREETTHAFDLIYPNGDNKICHGLQDKCSSIKTAYQLLEKEQNEKRITTFCKKLDEMLEGGIPFGKLIEICGTPGTGKTQLCLQLCLSVQLGKDLGGIDGEAIYIDTDGSFCIGRLTEIASAVVQHSHVQTRQQISDVAVQNLLKGIYYYKCNSYLELLALVNLLQLEIELKPKVRLVIIDSIALYFRYGFDGSFSKRAQILNSLAQSLIKVASEKDIAVVVTNEMTTRFRSEDSSHMVPALGESWAHTCAIRLLLFWDQTSRKALLCKSSSKGEESVEFQITQAGITDALNPYHSIPTSTNLVNKTFSRKRHRSESEDDIKLNFN